MRRARRSWDFSTRTWQRALPCLVLQPVEQAGLVGLDGEHVAGLADRITVTEAVWVRSASAVITAPFALAQGLDQLGHGRDLVGLGLHRLLGNDRPAGVTEGRHQVTRLLGFGAAATQGLS